MRMSRVRTKRTTSNAVVVERRTDVVDFHDYLANDVADPPYEELGIADR